ncbi:Conserved hypothetical protein [Prochlorococcus marinus str. MIT 9303]|uniref:Uncharacterized protein n=1 Tax=Prochlorococcus marinus (strain MIT 9303) TaxID=59922 RepID=A2CCR7_PROM3|nr:Conserved hypothetical protein [Prochlorococcus marinus str. MIT 9303]
MIDQRSMELRLGIALAVERVACGEMFNDHLP